MSARIAVIIVLLMHGLAYGEQIVIELKNGLSDPLIDFVPPPLGSPDRVSITERGMHIQQTGDKPGRITGVTGFKSMLPASGDFTITLEAKVNKLTGPSEGWGHGLIFVVFLDDPAHTALKLNQVAMPGSNYQTLVEISGRHVEQPIYLSGDTPLLDGKLIIERRGAEAIFSIEPKSDGQRSEVARVPCPTNDVRSVEVWSTRVDKGNAPSNLLIKRLTLDADAFYSFKRPVAGRFTWWQALIAAHVVVIGGAVSYMIWQRRKVKG